MSFNGNLFFYFVLPPIVFAAGFNMYRKQFFANITNILLFGVGGTFIAFGAYFGITAGITDAINLTQVTYDYHVPGEDDEVVNICQTGVNDDPDCSNTCDDDSLPVFDLADPLRSPCKIWKTIPLILFKTEIAIMCACLVSSDVIAAVSLISKKDQPKLFSVVFGEGIVNDAVSIILFNAVLSFAKSGDPLDGEAVGFIALEFVYLFIMSLLIGIFYGLFGSLLFKHLRVLTKSAVVECCYIFLIGYIAYINAEIFEFSGIISLLAAGIIMAQYAWYNLSI